MLFNSNLGFSWSTELVGGVGVSPILAAPIYLLTEPLIPTGVLDDRLVEIYALDNSASSGDVYNASLFHTGNGTEQSTHAWVPNANQYPQDGTIDMSIQGDGFGSIEARTNWIAPQDEEWTMSGIYNVVMGVSYDMYSIHYKGDQTCDIYLGSDTVSLALSEADKPYTPPTGNWIIEEEPPSIIINNTTYDLYINFDDLGTATPGIIVNTITTLDLSDASANMINNNGFETDITISLAGSPYLSFGGGIAADEVCMNDGSGLVNRNLTAYANTRTFNIVLPEGTFDVQVLASSTTSGTNRMSEFTLEGYGTNIIDAGRDNVADTYCASWTDVVGGQTLLFTTNGEDASGSSAYFNALKIIKTA